MKLIYTFSSDCAMFSIVTVMCKFLVFNFVLFCSYLWGLYFALYMRAIQNSSYFLRGPHIDKLKDFVPEYSNTPRKLIKILLYLERFQTETYTYV